MMHKKLPLLLLLALMPLSNLIRAVRPEALEGNERSLTSTGSVRTDLKLKQQNQHKKLAQAVLVAGTVYLLGVLYCERCAPLFKDSIRVIYEDRLYRMETPDDNILGIKDVGMQFGKMFPTNTVIKAVTFNPWTWNCMRQGLSGNLNNLKDRRRLYPTIKELMAQHHTDLFQISIGYQ